MSMYVLFHVFICIYCKYALLHMYLCIWTYLSINARTHRQHKEPEHTDVRNRQCSHEGCKRQPLYGPGGGADAGAQGAVHGRASVCGRHKLAGYQDLVHPRSCPLSSSFFMFILRVDSSCSFFLSLHLQRDKGDLIAVQSKETWSQCTWLQCMLRAPPCSGHLHAQGTHCIPMSCPHVMPSCHALHHPRYAKCGSHTSTDKCQ